LADRNPEEIPLTKERLDEIVANRYSEKTPVRKKRRDILVDGNTEALSTKSRKERLRQMLVKDLEDLEEDDSLDIWTGKCIGLKRVLSHLRLKAAFLHWMLTDNRSISFN
jgi:hypothetical protein